MVRLIRRLCDAWFDKSDNWGSGNDATIKVANHLEYEYRIYFPSHSLTEGDEFISAMDPGLAAFLPWANHVRAFEVWIGWRGSLSLYPLLPHRIY